MKKKNRAIKKRLLLVKKRKRMISKRMTWISSMRILDCQIKRSYLDLGI
jgi:hypothetical protein